MATTTNYSWTTPDDTDLVKDGAAAIRTLGSSVDTTTFALNPSTTLGDIEYRSSTANTNTRLGIGTTGQVLAVSGGVPAWTTPASGASYAVFTDVKSSGTNGGTFTTGAWRTRDINTSQYNGITGASISSNQITLDAGTYLIAVDTSAYDVNGHQTRFYNITDSAVSLTGQSSFSLTTSDAQTHANLEGVITIAATKVFELQHQCQVTRSTNGFGIGNSFGDNVYSIVSIAKIG
jgi:hypothetical protein